MSVKEPAALRACLRLYVAGQTPGARRALDNRLRLIAELDGKVEIEIIDILLQPEEAEKAGILATPTLADETATPPRRLVGDISDVRQVLEFFGYRKKDDGS